jgi:hypothetical protein
MRLQPSAGCSIRPVLVVVSLIVGRPVRPGDKKQWLLRRTRHQEHWLAVGTHYGPTRIYGPTGHAIGGTAQLGSRGFKGPPSGRNQGPAISLVRATARDANEHSNQHPGRAMYCPEPIVKAAARA